MGPKHDDRYLKKIIMFCFKLCLTFSRTALEIVNKFIEERCMSETAEMQQYVPQLVELAYISPEITAFPADAVAIAVLVVVARLLHPVPSAAISGALPPVLMTEDTARCSALLIRRLTSHGEVVATA